MGKARKRTPGLRALSLRSGLALAQSHLSSGGSQRNAGPPTQNNHPRKQYGPAPRWKPSPHLTDVIPSGQARPEGQDTALNPLWVALPRGERLSSLPEGSADDITQQEPAPPPNTQHWQPERKAPWDEPGT